MSDDSFVHDTSKFEPAAAPSSVESSDAETKYAELVAEVIWDGVITAEERKQLVTAAELYGLNRARAEQIEQALTAAYEARHSLQVLDRSDEAGEAAPPSEPIEPLAPSGDPRLEALQRRIAAVERRNDELTQKNAKLREASRQLEAQVAELQQALESQAAPSSTDESPAEASAEQPAADAAAKPPSINRLVPASGGQEVIPPARPTRGDPAEIHRLLRADPRDIGLLRALFNSLERVDDLDRRWCIAHTLVYLGEANDQEHAAHAKYVSEDIVHPARAVNKDEWIELLTHPDQDRLTGEILAEVAPAVVLGQLAALRNRARAEVADGEIDPHKSELEAVRCFAWASAFLGLAVPRLTVAPDYPGMAELVLSPKPSTRLGRQAFMGHAGKELAFMAGRHLCWYRREHILGRLVGNLRQLEDLFLAALMLGNPGLPMTEDIKQRVEPIAHSIGPLLEPAAVERLRHCFTRFVEQGGRTVLATWLQGVDRTAACTGLLLANDLRAAEAILKLEDPNRATERMDELIVFFTAGRCSLLRKRIGIGVIAP